MLKSFKLFSFALIAVVVVQAGCAQQSDQQQADNQAETSTVSVTNAGPLVAVVHPTEGNNATGTVTFEETENGVRVQAEIQGLSEGNHGFHIHQYGDCTASDATSAGGHYNPTDNPHGAPDDTERHMGDMGNIEANAQGLASIDYVDDTIQLNSILGRAVVVHGGEDDLTSQPSGDAGSRLACGVIGVANTGQ